MGAMRRIPIGLRFSECAAHGWPRTPSLTHRRHPTQAIRWRRSAERWAPYSGVPGAGAPERRLRSGQVRRSCDAASKPCSARAGWTPISPRRSSCWDQAVRPHLTTLTREARQRRPDRRSAGTDPEWIDAAPSADSKLRTALGQVGVELIGLVSVLVDLVLLEHPPPHPTPDHIAVLVHDLAVGPVQMIAPTDADRRVPRHALGHHLVCADLDPRCGEAAQPELDLPLAVKHHRPRVLALERERHVGGIEPKGWTHVPGAGARHQVRD